MEGLKDIIKDAIREVAQIEPQFLEITEEGGTLLIYFTPEISRKKEHKIRLKLHKVLNRSINSIKIISSPYPLLVIEYYTKFEREGTKTFIYHGNIVTKSGLIDHYEGIARLGFDKTKRVYFIIEGIGEDYHLDLINIGGLSNEEYYLLNSAFPLILTTLHDGYPLKMAVLEEDIFSIDYHIDPEMELDIVKQIKIDIMNILKSADVKIVCYSPDFEMGPESRITIFAYFRDADEILEESFAERLIALNKYLKEMKLEHRIVELYSDNFSRGKAIKISYWLGDEEIIQQKIYVW